MRRAQRASCGRARRAGAFVALAVALAPSGCTLDAPPPPDELASAASVVDCGTLEPALTVTCNDGTPRERPVNRSLNDFVTVAVPLMPESIARELELSACALGLDPGRAAIARVRASCAVEVAATAVRARLVLEGHAERRCGLDSQGSQGEVRSRWRAAIVPPANSAYQVAVHAEVTPDTPCYVQLGDAEPRLPSRTPLVLARVTGATPLIVDCSGDVGRAGLAVTGCYGWVEGTPASPATITGRITLDVTMLPLD